MKKKTFFGIFLGICLFLSLHAKSQFNIHYRFSDFGQKVGVGYTFAKEILNFDVSLYGTDAFKNLSPEFVLTANLITKEKFSIFLGVGATINDLNYVVIPVGVKIKPFNQLPKLQFKVDLTTMINYEYSDDKYIPGLGIVYYF